MKTSEVQDYLSLLCELRQTLEQLTEIEQKKTMAVRQDDLNLLNECMKQEQVLSLTLRGYEQKRLNTLSAWNLEHLPLSGLSSHVPPEHRMEAKRIAEELMRQYALFKGSMEVAQNTIECNLHQVEKHLNEIGASPSTLSGYDTVTSELPSSLRTDFRA